MNIKVFILLLLLPSTILSFGQNFSKIDRYAIKAPRNISKDITTLTKYLEKDYSLDLEKVRSFYTWIAHNISYDNAAYKKGSRRINQSNADVLDRRKAVCFGYSTLFKEMCSLANIPCEVVYGYPKNQETGIANLTSTSHAWNAVFVNGVWNLLDITWGSGNNRAQFEYYFLKSGEEMIYSHLPADPMWQLLHCPISPSIFRKSDGFIKSSIVDTLVRFNYIDSINNYIHLPASEKKLMTTYNSYFFNPVVENKEELGHTYMDQVNTLNDQVESLELTDSIEAIQKMHLRIIALCQKAERYIDLYDHQKENLAYSHLNYGIALSKTIQSQNDPAPILKKMQFHFEKAKNILVGLPNNFVLEHAILQIETYMEWIRSY